LSAAHVLAMSRQAFVRLQTLAAMAPSQAQYRSFMRWQ
jgi:hypothetical protein